MDTTLLILAVILFLVIAGIGYFTRSRRGGTRGSFDGIPMMPPATVQPQKKPSEPQRGATDNTGTEDIIFEEKPGREQNTKPSPPPAAPITPPPPQAAPVSPPASVTPPARPPAPITPGAPPPPPPAPQAPITRDRKREAEEAEIGFGYGRGGEAVEEPVQAPQDEVDDLRGGGVDPAFEALDDDEVTLLPDWLPSLDDGEEPEPAQAPQDEVDDLRGGGVDPAFEVIDEGKEEAPEPADLGEIETEKRRDRDEYMPHSPASTPIIDPQDLEGSLPPVPINQMLEAAQEVEFSAYYPKEVVPEKWEKLHAYIFRASASSEVADDAGKQLGDRKNEFRLVGSTAKVDVPEGATVTATPRLDGFQFNPPSVSLGFYKDWHRFDFELRAKGAPLNQSTNGTITFTVEGIIVADIPLSIYVGETVSSAAVRTTAEAKLYQAIFCSYSHQDTQIVARAERAYKALGMDYLRDVISLKSGQEWDDELLNLISRADIFQLFWSPAAADSPYVRQEWEHALKLNRDNFIRPVYWDAPQPPIPAQLGHIHFAYQPDLDD